MPFLSAIIRNYRQVKERNGSLQVHHALLQGIIFSQNNIHRTRSVTPKRSAKSDRPARRVSHNISKRKKLARASLTLEAACVLPVFLFAVLNMYAAINDIGLHVRMQTAMHQTGLSLARHAYAYERVAQGAPVLQSELADIAFSQSYVKRQVEEALGEGYLQNVGVSGGADGISFLQSDILTTDDITLVATYRMNALFLPEEFLSFGMVNRVRLRGWTGYDNTANAGKDARGEQIVYVTEYGEVFHCSRGCRYLNITIRQTDRGRLSRERNESGGKYTACELCGSRRETGVLYISEDGNRYHTTAACRALKRTVRALPRSEVGTKAPCSVCGGNS